MTRRSQLLVMVLTVSAGAACDDPADPKRGLSPLIVAPSQLYAGAELRIVGADASRLATMWLQRESGVVGGSDSLALAIVRRRADTVVVRVPPTAYSGVYSLRVSGEVAPIGSVAVAGFRQARLHEGLDGCTLHVIEGPVPTIMAARYDALVKFLPQTGEVTELLPASYMRVADHPIGVSYRPEIIFPLTRPSGYEAWRVAPTFERVGTVPFDLDYQLYQISDSAFVFTSHDQLGSAILSNGSWRSVMSSRPQGYWHVRGSALSPRGDIGLVLLDSAMNGQPVFDGRTGRIRYHVPLRGAYHADFSDSGDTLYVVGHDFQGINLLFAIDPQTGMEHRRTIVDTGGLMGLGVDRVNNKVIVGVYRKGFPTDTAEVHIFDGRTLDQLGLMSMPSRYIFDPECSRLAFDSSRIFIVEEIVVMEFDYLP